jgi:ketosteroid isomerase-like protein
MRTGRAWIAVLAVAACGGGKPAAAPRLDPVDERKAEKEAKGLVTEIYDTIERARTGGLMPLLADPLFVLGPRRADALSTRSDALVALRETLEALGKKTPSLSSNGLSVVVSPGGLSAWAVDTLSVQGDRMAVTAVLTNHDDFWLVTAASLAYTPPMKQVRAKLEKDAVVPPGVSGVKKLDNAARAAVDRFTRGLADPAIWGDDLGGRTNAVVIGPAAGDVTRGKGDIKKLWKKRAKSFVRAAPAGDVSAGVTADGQLAWVSAPVVRFAEDDEPLPLRMFAVFEKSGADWKLIALHEALAFDEPGVGVNFKKLPPPPIGAPDEPPPPPKPSDESKPKKKKKKKPKGR